MSPVIITYAISTLAAGLLYATVGCSFYFGSVANRYLNFAVAIPLIAVPHVVAACAAPTRWLIAGPAIIAVAAICAAGLLWLSHRARKASTSDGQLMVMSLAVLAVFENVIRLWRGNESIGFAEATVGASGLSTMTLIALLSVIVVCVALLSRFTPFGLSTRAVAASRDSVALAGISVKGLEAATTFAGCILSGIAGIGWAYEWRVRPDSAFTAALLGVVSYVIGRRLNEDVLSVIGAAVAIAIARCILLVAFQSDWTMTALLIVFLGTTVFAPQQWMRRRIAVE
ncbi:MAG TPA: hypothetical protein VNN08_07900 [Thermoanaerobaculia bacterium]|nr:hypothetical protein [Thermoanaerobaculia bacterium]